MSLQEVLDSYNHINLTEDEVREALIWRKRKKEAELKELDRKKREIENRKYLTGTQWVFEQTRAFMLYRANNIFEKPFVIDEKNTAVFDLLCYYFSADEKFVSYAENIGIINPSLDKGILLCGNYGVGKTWLMKLFQKNQRQVYHIHNAKEVADLYQSEGDESIQDYLQKHKNAFNDPGVFYQQFAALCIDDIGAEDKKNNYGNKRNVIGDIIEMRYHKQLMGIWFHGSTNLTSAQIKEYYGGRVISRLRETVNFIELGGNDRRR